MSTPTHPGSRRVRVLVVDDSLFMRSAIAKTLAHGPFEVVGQAKNGREALDLAGKLQPDVITMDFNMPGMNGAETVRALMQQRPTPVVMFSAHTRQGAKETFDALAAGAVDFVTKPAGEVSVDLGKVEAELTRKLLAAASARPRAAAPPAAGRTSAGSSMTSIPRTTLTGALPRVCCIAVSTGGPAALGELIPALPADLRIAIVVVQHMPAGFTGPLAERLDGASRVSVHEAEAGDRPLAGSVLIAPGDRHLEFDDRGMVVLTDGPPVHGCRPAADVTMLSAVKVYGRRTLAVVMTGMGKDGAAGALAIKRAEGKTCAQDQQSCVIFGMPKAAIDAGAIDEVVPLADLAGWLRYA
jgi:two-component system chemotaxis response regulator CheB